jgi:hypothetical protein
MLAVDVPHAALTYGPNPPVRECAGQACAAPKPAPGGLATSKPSVKLRPAQREAAGSAVNPPPAVHQRRRQVMIQYRTIRAFPSGFIAMITIQGHDKPGAWTLTFSFAGAQVQHVLGAQWQPDSTGNGGVATGQPWPWPGQKPGTSRIVIFAGGHSSTPGSCSFDGASCSFG